MLFLNALGYDVFNPLEVVLEFIGDIGTKKGEKSTMPSWKKWLAAYQSPSTARCLTGRNWAEQELVIKSMVD